MMDMDPPLVQLEVLLPAAAPEQPGALSPG